MTSSLQAGDFRRSVSSPPDSASSGGVRRSKSQSSHGSGWRRYDPVADMEIIDRWAMHRRASRAAAAAVQGRPDKQQQHRTHVEFLQARAAERHCCQQLVPDGRPRLPRPIC